MSELTEASTVGRGSADKGAEDPHVRQEDLEEVFDAFWAELVSAVPRHAVVPILGGGRGFTSHVRLWREPAEAEAAGLLSELGIELVAPEQRDRWYQLRGKNGALRELALGDIVAKVPAGPGPTTPERLLPPLGRPGRMNELWSVLELLLSSTARSPQASRRALLDRPIAPATDGALWPIKDLVKADVETRETLSGAGANARFLDTDLLAERPQLASLVEPLRAGRALDLLEVAADGARPGPNPTAIRLLRWLHRHNGDFDDSHLRRIARLPIFPTSDGPRPLRGLALPGNFHDPLNLTRLIATDGLEDMSPFLRSLGAEPLTFAVYCSDFVPLAFEGDGPDQAIREALIQELAVRLSQVKENDKVHGALRPLELIPCDDGLWRAPGEVYLTPAFQ